MFGFLKKSFVLFLLLCIIIPVIIPVSLAQEDLTDLGELYSELYSSNLGDSDDSYYTPLIMDIYLDDSGKMLILGYVNANDLNNLSFLDSSEYVYDESTNELYVVTDALTSKKADLWTLDLSFGGYYTEAHLSVYLPPGAVFKTISYSEGFDHFVGMSDDSVVVDIQGFDTEEPEIVVEYRQNIGEDIIPSDSQDTFQGGDGGDVSDQITDGSNSSFFLIIALFLVVAAVAFILISTRSREKETDNVATTRPDTSVPKKELNGAIEVTSEMRKVIGTLSDRERSIVEALIKNNGKLSQADIRYETEIPKSSLTGIIYNLEQKKIITKKQKGRTNIIELSEWFLFKKEL